MRRFVLRGRGLGLPLSCLALYFALGAGDAFAQSGDGAYGRFDSASSLVFGAGASVAPRSGNAAALLDARLRLFDSVGIATSFTLAPERRSGLFAGIELRPLFPGLFLQSMSTGRWFVDLLVQSIGVELGTDVALARGASLGFAWGLSFEIPLLTPERFAHGLGLRLGARHTAFFGDSRPNPAPDSASKWQLYALVALGLDVGSSVARWEPVRHRER